MFGHQLIISQMHKNNQNVGVRHISASLERALNVSERRGETRWRSDHAGRGEAGDMQIYWAILADGLGQPLLWAGMPVLTLCPRSSWPGVGAVLDVEMSGDSLDAG